MWHAAVHMLLKSTYYIMVANHEEGDGQLNLNWLIGHHPVHSDRLHYPSSIKTNWWMINDFIIDKDDGHHG